MCRACLPSKWYCGCVSILLYMELRNVVKKERETKVWDEVHTFEFEKGRSATEISTAIRLLAAAAGEWGPDVGVITFIGCEAGF